VRDELVKDPHAGELNEVHRVIELVGAEKLEILNTDGGDQRQRCHPIPIELVQVEGDSTTHAEGDDVRARHAESVEPLIDIPGVGTKRVIGDRMLGRAKSREIGKENSALSGERGSQPCEILQTSRASMKEDDGETWSRGREVPIDKSDRTALFFADGREVHCVFARFVLESS
jgi:hypothetical protein